MTSEKNATKEPMFSEMTRAQRATLLGIITPILTVIFVLKTMSVTQYEPANRPWYAWPDLFLSDIAWGIGVSTSALALVGHRRIGLKALPFIQLAFISWMFFELVGYKFYFTTGSTLDWQLIVLYVRYIEQLWGMVSIFNETFSKSLIFGLLGLLAMLPWVMHWRMPADPKDKDFISPKKLAIVGITGVVLSPVFPLVATEQRLGRNTIVELGVSAVEHFRQKANSRQHLQLSRSDRKLTPRADTPPKNVVVIVMESTGAHVTGPYNPKAEKFTPTLTELAKESLVMENALTIVPHTSKALFSIHCGTLPNPTAALTEAGSNGILAPCLPELLGTQGYETAFFQGATMFFEDRYSLLENFGYDYMYGREELNADNTPFEKLNYFGYESKALLEPAKRWLDDKRDQNAPFLLTFLTLAPHHDYVVPKGFEARQLHEDKEFDRYLNCVSYVDEFIGDVIALLEEQGVYEDTVIVIVGDHGEGFGEHSRYYHDNVIYQEALKIPILYHGPGVPAGERIEQVSNQLDILPTLSHLAGFELEGTFEGVQVLDNQKVAQPRELTSYCWYERACAAHFQWPYKYVYHFDQHPDELYNLLDDPKERTNLLDTKSHHTLPDHIDPKEMKSTLLDTLEKAQAHHQASGE